MELYDTRIYTDFSIKDLASGLNKTIEEDHDDFGALERFSFRVRFLPNFWFECFSYVDVGGGTRITHLCSSAPDDLSASSFALNSLGLDLTDVYSATNAEGQHILQHDLLIGILKFVAGVSRENQKHKDQHKTKDSKFKIGDVYHFVRRIEKDPVRTQREKLQLLEGQNPLPPTPPKKTIAKRKINVPSRKGRSTLTQTPRKKTKVG
jgi:hypothetical protein